MPATKLLSHVLLLCFEAPNSNKRQVCLHQVLCHVLELICLRDTFLGGEGGLRECIFDQLWLA